MVYEECQDLYERMGVSAVTQHVITQQLADNPMYEDVKYKYCKGCEAGYPNLLDTCLVCGSSTIDVKEVNIGDRINTVGELREILKDLDDNDLICLETIDDNGDVQDLYPMYVDVIDGIELIDKTIVREVRFCQMPNVQQSASGT